MSGQNPAIEAIDRVISHLETLQPGSVVTGEFIAEHALLLQQAQTYVQGLLIESRHAADGYKALQDSYAALSQHLPKP